jgi:hypothetical protein
LSDEIPYTCRKAAFHEAGHALIAWKEGFEIHSIVIRKGSAEAHTSPLLPGRSTEQYALARIRVLLAGAAAQCIALHPSVPTCTADSFTDRGDAHGDWIRAEELARLVVHHRSNGAGDDAAAAAAADKLLNDELQFVATTINHERTALNRVALGALVKVREHLDQDDEDPTWSAEAKIEQTELLSLLHSP